MKKLINSPSIVVEEAMLGMARAHPHLLRAHFDPNYIVRADALRPGKVGVLSGGGSGHEPMHGGFVGAGMLDAACPGRIFTSPTPDQIEAACHAIHSGAGILFIVKNYTGDILNFDIAAELCRANGIDVATLLIHDDVAVQDSLYTAGRRGVGITVFAEKICGNHGRSWRTARPCRRYWPQSGPARAQHGHGAHVLHCPRGGTTHLCVEGR